MQVRVGMAFAFASEFGPSGEVCIERTLADVSSVWSGAGFLPVRSNGPCGFAFDPTTMFFIPLQEEVVPSARHRFV